MNDYYKILEIQQLSMTSKVRINKYIKIKIHTHDDNLRELLKNRIERRKCAYDDLRDYCKNQIKQQIPTWQIAAKKAGWQLPEQMDVILNLGK